MKTLSLFSASLLSLSLAACAQQPQQSEHSNELSNEDYDDIAAGLGAMVALPGGGGEVSSFADAVSTSTEPSGNLVEGSGAHEVVVRAGLSYEYRADCFDADGNELDACGEGTDSANVSVSWSGEIDTPRYDATIDRAGEWGLSGLQSDTAVIAGSGSFEVDSAFQALYRDVTRSMHFSYDAEYRDVQVDTATHQTIGGSVLYNVQGERYVQRGSLEKDITFSVQAEVSFHADGTATLALDGEHSYEIDLNSGEITPEEPAES